MQTRTLLVLFCLSASTVALADAAPVFFEGDCFPEEIGFERFEWHKPDRWNDDGWLIQEIEVGDGSGGPYDGQGDTYHYDLGAYAGSPFFIEWRMITNAPEEEIDPNNGAAGVILVGGSVTYYCRMSRSLAKIFRSVPDSTHYFEISPDVAHTYRLEVRGDEYYSFAIDDVIVDDGLPEAIWPTPNALLSFGSRYYLNEHITQWDYVRFGSIPEPGNGAERSCRVDLAGWKEAVR